MVWGLLYAFDDVLVEPLRPKRAVATLDVRVLLGLHWLDMVDDNRMFLSPFYQLFAYLFRAIVNANGAALTPPLDVPIKDLNHAFGGQGKVDVDAQPFAIEVVQHVQ